MRIDNAYRIVKELRKNDRRYHRLISKIESKIEYQKRLSFVCCLELPNIDFKVRTNAKLSKGEIKATRVYLNEKHFGYTRAKISLEYQKRLFGGRLIVKLK